MISVTRGAGSGKLWKVLWLIIRIFRKVSDGSEAEAPGWSRGKTFTALLLQLNRFFLNKLFKIPTKT